jgi:hypothetical protein
LDRTDSNAKLFLARNNSNALLALTRYNSNALLANNELTMANSNAIYLLDEKVSENSNAIQYLSETKASSELVRTLSNALLYGDRVNSNTILYLDRTDSNAKLFLARNNSNALLALTRYNSNALLYGDRTNSNAFAAGIKHNSDTIYLMLHSFSNTILELIERNSQALIYLNRTTSNALLFGDRINSNAIIFMDAKIASNSNALLYNIRVQSNALVYHIRTESNALEYHIKNQSNALVFGLRSLSNSLLFGIKNLSDAILQNELDIRSNSQAIVLLDQSLRVNSNALLYGDRINSNTILYLDRTDSNAKLFLARNNSNALLALTRFNSNAIVGGSSELAKQNSNALLALTRYNSNALLLGDRVNSNAITHMSLIDPSSQMLRTLSNALLFGDRVNSNTILYLDRTDSNAKLFLARNNSNALLALSRFNSNAIVGGSSELAKQNSNALLALTRFNSNALLYGDRVNSNTVINIINGGTCTLVAAPLTTSITMQGNCDVSQTKAIDIRESIIINGQGGRITFSNPENPQFIIASGKTVRLENVTLMCIGPNTFSFGKDSILEIGHNVIFELCDHVALEGAYITVLGDEYDPNVFTMRGRGAQRRFQLLPIYKKDQVIKTFNLGLATLLLENVEFIGLDSVSVRRVDDGIGIFVGAMAPANRSTIDVNIDTDMNVFVEGPNNTMRFFKTGLTYSGFLNFSSEYDSELHVAFDLGEKIIPYPLLNLEDEAIFLGSEYGRARLIFDDYAVTLRNLGTNSFIADTNSYLGGHIIEVLDAPIQQYSIDLVLDSRLDMISNMPNAIDSSSVRIMRNNRRIHPVTTALELLRNRQDETFAQKHDKQKQKPVQNITYAGKKEKAKKQSRVADELITRATKINKAKTFDLPTNFDLSVNAFVQSSNTSGVIGVKEGGLTLFGVSRSDVMSLYLRGDTVLEQGSGDVLVKTGDTLYVEGESNKILVTNKFVIAGQLIFNQNAHLIFEFDKKSENPMVIFDSSAHQLLQIPTQTRIEFRGNGTVWFQDGMAIELQGNNSDDKAIFAVTDLAKMRLSSKTDSSSVGDATVRMYGMGYLFIDDGAQLFVNGGQQLIIGDSAKDVIDIVVDRNSRINVNAENELGKYAYISLQKAEYSLLIKQGALLDIGKNGVFEINALNNVKQSGLLTSLNIGNGGNLLLDQDGTLAVGPNKLKDRTTEWPLNFTMLGGLLEGTGIVQLPGTPMGGRIQNREFNSFDSTAQGFVRKLINLRPTLNFSTVFIDKDGTKWLINKDVDLYNTNKFNPKINLIKLYPDDDIRSDDPKTGNVYGYNRNVLFAILPNGSRE